jgi:hypothetical protein
VLFAWSSEGEGSLEAASCNINAEVVVVFTSGAIEMLSSTILAGLEGPSLRAVGSYTNNIQLLEALHSIMTMGNFCELQRYRFFMYEVKKIQHLKQLKRGVEYWVNETSESYQNLHYDGVEYFDNVWEGRSF